MGLAANIYCLLYARHLVKCFIQSYRLISNKDFSCHSVRFVWTTVPRPTSEHFWARVLLHPLIEGRGFEFYPSRSGHMCASSCGFTGEIGNPWSFCTPAGSLLWPPASCGGMHVADPSWTQWFALSLLAAVLFVFLSGARESIWEQVAPLQPALLPPSGAAVTECLPHSRAPLLGLDFPAGLRRELEE